MKWIMTGSGAGPVGCLTAIAFAKAGWKVAIYDARPDMRLPSSKQALAQRSVNLAISSRGLAALYSVDPSLMNKVLDGAIPMKGRRLHVIDGKIKDQLYDSNGQCINSIDRGILNESLLEEAIAFPTIDVYFKHKLLTADFDICTLTFEAQDIKKNVDIKFDLCIGADGSYSNVRRQMMRVTRMDYQQEYIPHEYIELKIPAGIHESGAKQFLLDHNYLHIWPRHSFMLIALPNKDKTVTATLFAPTSVLDQLNTRSTAAAWFNANFPDIVSLVGEETLLTDFQRNPRNPLISLKVYPIHSSFFLFAVEIKALWKAKPYHYKDRCIIIGDAAHSMVPFYGQGLNCGLEDIRVLLNILRSEGAFHPRKRKPGQAVDHRLENAFERYSATRHEDLVAIRDLAMDNYVEMRHSVTTPTYIFRKALDSVFSTLTAPYVPFATLARTLSTERTAFPPGASRGWLSQYTMVTFRPDISYATAKKKVQRQSNIVTGIMAVTLGGGAGLVMLGVWAALVFRRR
ncbi:FAD/NAD-P-binding domain-containing protein [Hysterangium stoloniferum]|nr:FAD/NAD-P-binding domain-containing protein [Hysterangium stoloniferum]